jgi:hypothetical protein
MSAENKCKICSHHGRIHLKYKTKYLKEKMHPVLYKRRKPEKTGNRKNDIKKILKREMISRKPHIDKSIRKE